MSDGVQQDWPNEGPKVLITTTILNVLSTIFLFWRCAYALMQRGKFLICDYLFITAWALSVVNTTIRFILVDNGFGRHIKDPSITHEMLIRYSYFLWINQIVNIIAVAVLKWGICAYLLVPGFSRVYRAIIWFSILVVTAINFLAPVFTLFGCVPLEANWNRTIKNKKCWARGSMPLSYAQGIVNIMTDVVYVVAPIVYLSRVKLPKRTQWGLRVVFLFSIIAMVCSIFKTIELRNISKTMDPTWSGVDLSIWSGAELQVGIFIASLPPLRRVFDKFFCKCFPGLSTSAQKSSPSYGTPAQSRNFRTHGTEFQMNPVIKSDRTRRKSGYVGESALDTDGDSEKAILDDQERMGGGGIRKTTSMMVTTELKEGSRQDNFPNNP